MMLPEHKGKMVKYRQQHTKKEKPLLDAQHLETLSQVIHAAMCANHTVVVELYDPFETQTLTGAIAKVDVHKGQLKLSNDEGNTWVALQDVLNISVV